MMFLLPPNSLQAAFGIFLALMLAFMFQPSRVRAGLRWYVAQWRRSPWQTAILSYLLFAGIAYGGGKTQPPDPAEPGSEIRLRLYTDDWLRLRPLGWPITTTNAPPEATP